MNTYKYFTHILVFAYAFLTSCEGPNHSSSSTNDALLKTSLPGGGRLVNDKPTGKNWIDLIASLDNWNLETQNWKLDSDILHGDYNGGQFHSYGYTKSRYKNFELNAVFRLTGKEANSGICIRINPTDFDNAPGYQVDMGPGYWGCLWEERRDGMVQKYPSQLADKLVKQNDWNHYYIIARDHHIQAWLNGVKTIDTVHVKGFSEGAIGLQLCHGDKHTVIDVKTLSLRILQ
jgi:3-keto-disaccharide hydrolase